MEGNPDRKIRIMGIVNLTDDSFFAGSRFRLHSGFSRRAAQKQGEGKNEGKPSTWAKIQKLYNIPDDKMWAIIKQSM